MGGEYNQIWFLGTPIDHSPTPEREKEVGERRRTRIPPVMFLLRRW
jgi:hypothetical protein